MHVSMIFSLTQSRFIACSSQPTEVIDCLRIACDCSQKDVMRSFVVNYWRRKFPNPCDAKLDCCNRRIESIYGTPSNRLVKKKDKNITCTLVILMGGTVLY